MKTKTALKTSGTWRWLGTCGAVAACELHKQGYDHVPGDVLDIDHGNGNGSAMCRKWVKGGAALLIVLGTDEHGRRGFIALT